MNVLLFFSYNILSLLLNVQGIANSQVEATAETFTFEGFFSFPLRYKPFCVPTGADYSHPAAVKAMG